MPTTISLSSTTVQYYSTVPFLICEDSSAWIDVCVMDDDNDVFLLLQNDISMADPEPQLVAAFALNDMGRQYDLSATL